jgi:hypothetical protein
LKDVWEERANQPEFAQRNKDYGRYDSYYRGIPAPDDERPGWWTRGSGGYPRNIDEQLKGRGDPRAAALVVNWASQVVNHFTSMFARMPRVHKLPAGSGDAERLLADQLTDHIRTVFMQSRMGALQGRQAHWFSKFGDAVYSVEPDTAKKRIYVRAWNPQECFPDFDPLDYGGMKDILIRQTVARSWAERTYGIAVDGQSQQVEHFIYWDTERRVVAINRHEIQNEAHGLGFVPFRWAFSRPTGTVGTSDIKDIVDLQDSYNEMVALMFVALRKNVHKAYWGKGLQGDITPIPDSVQSLGMNAEINEFPGAEPPSVAIQAIAQIATNIGQVAGISSISLEGEAQGSIVTGSAVRNQVQAVEARAETKRVMLETTYAAIGEQILMVTEKLFADDPLLYRGRDGSVQQLTGKVIKNDYACTASFGQLYNLSLEQRVQVALQVLGKLSDERFAIELMDPESVTPSELARRIEQYQIHQAQLSAQAQQAAQQVAQEEQQPSSPGPGQAQGPQSPQGPPEPKPSDFMQDVGQLQLAITLLRNQLHGDVWGVGEIAIAGRSMNPMVLVEARQDVPAVQALLARFHAQVSQGSPNGVPALSLV